MAMRPTATGGPPRVVAGELRDADEGTGRRGGPPPVPARLRKEQRDTQATVLLR